MSKTPTSPKTILCVVGKSGTGKTSLALHLRKHIPFVSSRTTRDPRQGEISGEAPYHHFITTDAYIKDVVSSGKVDIGDLRRGDDIIIADTLFGQNTYWAKASDIVGVDSEAVGYIIDPQGVANLYKVIQKAQDLLIRYCWSEKQAPNLHKLAELRIKILHVSAVESVLNLTAQERRDRDNEQELGWDLCAALSDFQFITPNIPDDRERHILIGLLSKRLSEQIMRTL